MRAGSSCCAAKLVDALRALAAFARQWRAVPTLGYTHLQPAQLTTVGKRATLWMQDLVLDLADLDHRIAALPFRGVKGTTGTQASFLELFDGDHAKVRELDRRVTREDGLRARRSRSPGRPTRARSTRRCSASSPASPRARRSSAATCACCRRSARSRSRSRRSRSARRPWPTSATRCAPSASRRSRASCVTLEPNANQTHGVQWFERTLDDCANRRLVIPESVPRRPTRSSCSWRTSSRGLEVHPARIRRRVADELPFMATEELIVRAVRAGGDRQAAHERHPPAQHRGGPRAEGRRAAQRPARAPRRPIRRSACRSPTCEQRSTRAGSSAARPSRWTSSCDEVVDAVARGRRRRRRHWRGARMTVVGRRPAAASPAAARQGARRL